MAFVVQCDHCEQNNSADPTHGLHTMYQINLNQMGQSAIVQSPQLCDTCAIALIGWIETPTWRVTGPALHGRGHLTATAT